MSEELAAAYAGGISVTTLRREVAEGNAPKPHHISGRRVVWFIEELDAWMDRIKGQAVSAHPEKKQKTNSWAAAAVAAGKTSGQRRSTLR
ncbi:helix-turn-helix transcriptional regulator [Komagataeibacter saccharivorans]|uniref:helix-turn-helix transcriptional regulator n=1 Tax=Komagataeibacter saccharivorans TaxID=265959 RepID=UPI0039EC2F29